MASTIPCEREYSKRCIKMHGIFTKCTSTNGVLSLRSALEWSRKLSSSLSSSQTQQHQSQRGEPQADRALAMPSSASHHFNLRAFYLGESTMLPCVHDLSTMPPCMISVRDERPASPSILGLPGHEGPCSLLSHWIPLTGWHSSWVVLSPPRIFGGISFRVACDFGAIIKKTRKYG